MELRLALFFAGEYKVTKENYWHLLFVDDNIENCEIAAKYLNEKVVLEPDEKLKVDTEVDFNNAYCLKVRNPRDPWKRDDLQPQYQL